MERIEVLEKVKDCTETIIGGETDLVITESSRYEEDLGLDSLDLVELVIGLESEFGLEVSDEEARELETVGVTVDYIMSRIT